MDSPPPPTRSDTRHGRFKEIKLGPPSSPPRVESSRLRSRPRSTRTHRSQLGTTYTSDTAPDTAQSHRQQGPVQGARETRDALAVLLQCAQNQITCRMRIVRRDSAQVDRRSHSIIRVKESAICASRLPLVSTTKVARKLLGMNTLEPLWLCFLFVPSLRCVALKPPPAVLGVETWPPP